MHAAHNTHTKQKKNVPTLQQKIIFIREENGSKQHNKKKSSSHFMLCKIMCI